MIFFLDIIINIFFILLPNLLYVIYVCNKQNLNEDANKTILDLLLLISLLLIIMINSLIYNEINIIFIFITLIISLKHKRNIVSVLISFISIEFVYTAFNLNYFLMLLSFIFPVTINYILNNFKYKEYILLLIILSTSLFLFNIQTILIFPLSYLIITYVINRSFKILELQNLLKEYKKESELKVSLFKITHEIKNPLAVVKGYLSMINIDNKEKSIKYLNIINSEVERTINLLNDFREFSKIKIEKNSFELNTLLDEIKNILISLTDNNKIRLNFKVEKNIVINADYNRIKQVLINIIKNSIEASKINSNIDITCFTNKNLNIIVKDYGIGIDNDTLNRLFTPFNTTKEKGTGLGVCLSKEIIEAHKGKITYNSILNKGTIVKIVLPIN